MEVPYRASPIKVNLGGTGGDGGHGGDIEVVNQKKGIIESRGKNGIGVFAMSLGGGGGDVGTTQDLVTLGSKVGVGGNGGDITILNRGTIRTTGEGGVGILARSLGGGGGRVASSINGGKLHLGSTSSEEAKGGEVTVINTGNIYSFGHDSTPLQLDGIGGGVEMHGKTMDAWSWEAKTVLVINGQREVSLITKGSFIQRRIFHRH